MDQDLPFRKFQPEKGLPKILGDLFRVKICLTWAIIPFFFMFENPRRGRQARNFTTNAPKILDLTSSSEQIFSKNLRWVPLINDFQKQEKNG